MACVAADYKLKRLSLGADSSPVPGVGHGVDNSRAAGNRYWFETLYQPLLMSNDRNAFEVRGQRLTLKCGTISFDERGATPAARAFTTQFSQKFPALAAAIPSFADLQNLADLSLLAALIQQDKLDERIGWDRSWAVNTYRVAAMPVPKVAENIVAIRAGSLVAGGVILAPSKAIEEVSREIDKDKKLQQHRKQVPEGQWCVESVDLFKK